MNISKSQMQENVYNKTDADTWLLNPRLEDVKKTSFLDVTSLERYNPSFLNGLENEKELNLSELYTKKLDKTHKEVKVQQKETILGVSLSEIERQCQACYTQSQFDQPLNLRDYKDVIVEGGEKILNDAKTLKLVRKIYNNEE